jgi:hypothetical protein
VSVVRFTLLTGGVHCGCCCAAQTQNSGNSVSGPPVIGFCFSFAVEQAALNSGKLLVWTKGFNVEGVIGKDVVQLLSGVHCYCNSPFPASCSCHGHGQ